MVRMSKQERKRHVSPRSPRSPSPKTGPVKNNLPNGYKEHKNAVEETSKQKIFIPKIK